jgi:hypothetical protein
MPIPILAVSSKVFSGQLGVASLHQLCESNRALLLNVLGGIIFNETMKISCCIPRAFTNLVCHVGSGVLCSSAW